MANKNNGNQNGQQNQAPQVESALEFALTQVKNSYKKFAKNSEEPMPQGQAAFEQSGARNVRRQDSGRFYVGDKFVIKVENFVSLPMQKDGDPVPRCICEITDIHGAVRGQEVFAGTFTKAIRPIKDKTIGEVTYKAGETVSAVVAGANMLLCPTEKDVWNQLIGKTIEVTAANEFDVVRRGWNGQPDREGTTFVCNFKVG